MKPYPQYTTVSLYRNNVGTTKHHGVYAKLEQRFSRGLSYLVSYTRSKLVDDASSVFDASILTGPVANHLPCAEGNARTVDWQDRAHFFAVAARMIRLGFPTSNAATHAPASLRSYGRRGRRYAGAVDQASWKA